MGGSETGLDWAQLGEVCICISTCKEFKSRGLGQIHAEDSFSGYQNPPTGLGKARPGLAYMEQQHCPPWSLIGSREIQIHARAAGSCALCSLPRFQWTQSQLLAPEQAPFLMCFPSVDEQCQNSSECTWSYYFCFGKRAAQLLCFHIQMGFFILLLLLLFSLAAAPAPSVPGVGAGNGRWGLVPAELWLLLQPGLSTAPQDSQHFTLHKGFSFPGGSSKSLRVRGGE